MLKAAMFWLETHVNMFCRSRAVVGCADVKGILKHGIPPEPDRCVCLEGYWVPLGNMELVVDEKVWFRNVLT
jgi:hypothetical protein